MNEQERAEAHHAPNFALATVIYGAFVVYGSLVPLAFRYRPLSAAWAAFLKTPYLHLEVGSRADWVANLLLYMPLGFFAAGWTMANARWRPVGASVQVFALCVLLAVGVEFTQLFFPPRTVSLNDMLAETLGTGLGIALWLRAGERLTRLWNQLQSGGRQATNALIALYTLAYLVLSLFPFDFLVSAAELSGKLGNAERSAVFVTLSCGGAISCGAKLLEEVLIAAPLGVFLGMVTVAGGKGGLRRAFGWGVLLGAVIEGSQIILASGVSQGASILTRGVGMAVGLAIYRRCSKEWLARYGAAIRSAVLLALPPYLLLLLALSGFFTSQLQGYGLAAAKLREIHFLPFYYHYFTSETRALYSLLANVGAYAPIGLLVWIFGSDQFGRRAPWVAALAAASTALAMETLKLFLAGRKPDPTNVLIAAAAAALTWFVATRLTSSTAAEPSGSNLLHPENVRRAAPLSRSERLSGRKLAGGMLAATVVIVGWVIAVQPEEHFVDESVLPQLPTPEELPQANLTRFNFDHPRLPSPSAIELATLRARNPSFIRDVRARANGGKGDLQSAVLQELVEPGSVDLNLLSSRLMELTYSWRGHAQVKPLAVAYDWLYPQWNDSQRALLRGQLAEGCDYVIGVIRKERLSPYNVILYNSPFQALMACTLALYGDDPRGEPVMRFTHDLWKNRVLPVWRQVMGKNGGWHEGGEYVGIGIGQALHELAAMWRSATGEDLFATEPGIRGFLDFLVYRTRPDGTHFRWGDGGFFDKGVPDAIPLALEYRYPAAYKVRPTPNGVMPYGWPWGPLSDPTLYDPGAIARLPLTRHFDGIGMIVARSDWSPESTYVTFKAGDNYWSHTHLDQGAFTIYKGGELAIDSGFYGPSYGSDHHMNYSYQTIAHNTITVTDPADTVPAPGEEKPRPIANDGGQRRIGSGWGVEAAPLDLAEWEAKRDIYHTATMANVFDRDGLTVAVADITPAYTNSLSGRGTFSHRTRRVERFWRTFGYDREDDVVVVFDQVRATDAAFRKRWLLHTIEAPRIDGESFSVRVGPRTGPGRAGGRLEGNVLLPKSAQITAIGGRGLEFFVDNKNYDEDGKLQALIQKLGPNRGEPGAWRIEVVPPQDAADDLFLVVLLPTAGSERPTHRVRLLESGTRVGCEIVGSKRTTRWWFDPGRNGAEIEVLTGGESRRYPIEGRSTPPPPPQGSLAQLKAWLAPAH